MTVGRVAIVAVVVGLNFGDHVLGLRSDLVVGGKRYASCKGLAGT